MHASDNQRLYSGRITQICDANGIYSDFYMVVLESPTNLVLYRSTAASLSDTVWVPAGGKPISTNATSPGSITQSHFITGKNTWACLEVLVAEDTTMVYYNGNMGTNPITWSKVNSISNVARNMPAPIIQTSYGENQGHGNFETVVLQGNTLWHYYRANSWGTHNDWVKDGNAVSTKAVGPGSFIENTNGDFEVIVPEPNGVLAHYVRLNSKSSIDWVLQGTINDAAINTPAGFCQTLISGSDELEYMVIYISDGNLVSSTGTSISRNQTDIIRWIPNTTLMIGFNGTIIPSIMQASISPTTATGELGAACVSRNYFDFFSGQITDSPGSTIWSPKDQVNDSATG